MWVLLLGRGGHALVVQLWRGYIILYFRMVRMWLKGGL